MFASWLSDQFFGGIGWLILFAGALHLLFNKYGSKIDPTVRKEAGDAMNGGIIKAIRWLFKR
jgi:hypothetical protein